MITKNTANRLAQTYRDFTEAGEKLRVGPDPFRAEQYVIMRRIHQEAIAQAEHEYDDGLERPSNVSS